MRLWWAWKAFIKAFREPEKAKEFVEQKNAAKRVETTDVSHLRLLHDLQQAGRLIDFLKEDIGALNDAQVGAAVRKIHQDCARTVEELVAIRPLRDEREGSLVQIARGYNAAEIKLIGKVKGEPPFSGTLVHRGWRAQKRSLPKITSGQVPDVICPAEVEVM